MVVVEVSSLKWRWRVAVEVSSFKWRWSGVEWSGFVRKCMDVIELV